MSDVSNERRVLRIESEQRIKASPEKVFEAITTGINDWMPYRQRPDAKIVFETKPGGVIYEDWGEDGYLLFGTVAAYQPPHQLIVVGPDGYGETTFSSRNIERVEPDGNGGSIHKKTLLVWGNIPEEAEGGMRTGMPVMGELVRAYVETGKKFDPSQQDR